MSVIITIQILSRQVYVGSYDSKPEALAATESAKTLAQQLEDKENK